MNAKLVFVAASMVLSLVACGGGDGNSPPDSAPCASSNAEATPGSAAATADGADTADAGDAGPKKTASPLDDCDAEYMCDSCGEPGKGKSFWLHSDGASCMFGDPENGVVLHDDGSLTSKSGKTGTWSGDVAYLTISFPDVCYAYGSGGYSVDEMTCRREK